MHEFDKESVDMQEKSQKKFNAFKPTALSDWEVAAKEELKGGDPWEKLSIPLQGFTILPFYTQKETIPAKPLLSSSENSFLGPRTWYNCPAVHVRNEKTSNEEALDHLRNGADGIFFELNGTPDFHSLLRDIDSRFCALNFLVNANASKTSEALLHFLAKEKKLAGSIPVCFFGNEMVQREVDPDYFYSGLHAVPGSSIAEEIASCFASFATTYLRPTAISIDVDTDFFLTVTKLRALRILWKRFLEMRKASANIPLWIHARSRVWDNDGYQPHGNMLKSTTAAMAAILGGCDSLTLEPEDNDEAVMTRVARNVSNVLREESYFSKVADPIAGSFYVEALSKQLSEAAWALISSSSKS